MASIVSSACVHFRTACVPATRHGETVGPHRETASTQPAGHPGVTAVRKMPMGNRLEAWENRTKPGCRGQTTCNHGRYFCDISLKQSMRVRYCFQCLCAFLYCVHACNSPWGGCQAAWGICSNAACRLLRAIFFRALPCVVITLRSYDSKVPSYLCQLTAVRRTTMGKPC